MKERYHADFEAMSIAMSIEGILPRDFDTLDELVNDFSCLIRTYAKAANEIDNLGPDEENTLTLALEVVSNCLMASMAQIREIVKP